MDEENFWEVMDSCPECSRYVLFDAHHQHFKRKARQLTNMANQEDNLDINLLFKFKGRHTEDPSKLTRFKRTKFIN